MSQEEPDVLPLLSLRMYRWIVFHLLLLLTVTVAALIVYSAVTARIPEPPVEFVGEPVLLTKGRICGNDTIQREHQIAIRQGGRVCLSLTVFDTDHLMTVVPERHGDATCFNWPDVLIDRTQIVRRPYKLNDLPPGNYSLVGTMFKQDGAYGRFELPFKVSEC